ncbi:MAG: OmpA family protein [Geobacter sp.]|nr:MAG: OmpA family protein [Geobacter sp.]
MKALIRTIALTLGMVVFLALTVFGENSSAALSGCSENGTTCTPCRDSLTGAPVACSGSALGQRVDDGRVYMEILPPSSERAGGFGNYFTGSHILLPQKTIKQASTALLSEEKVETLPQARIVVRLGDTRTGALFDSGKDRLLPAAITRLDNLAAQMRGKKHLKLEVVGHTDNIRIGIPETKRRFAGNQQLSEARASAVARYLQKVLELSDDAVAISGKGETRPIADNATVDGRARNRRAEIAFWYDEDRPNPAYGDALKEQGRVVSLPAEAAASTPERQACGTAGPADRNDLPFRVTVDGQPVSGDTLMPEADRQRCVDVSLAKSDIQVRFDPLQTKPALNVWSFPDGPLRGKPVEFGVYSNYLSWIMFAEVRVFSGSRPSGKPLASVPVSWDQPVIWTVPVDAPEEMCFLVRVYDKQGRFDETAVKPLRMMDKSRPHSDSESAARERMTGWGQDSRALATIPVSGGTVTVNGTGIRPEQTVLALGMVVPVDSKGSFAIRQIYPSGPHTVSVAVAESDGRQAVFSRNLTIPDQDWFYVAIGDLTVGQNNTSGPANLVTGDVDHTDGKVFVDGRAAFYLKGKIKGEYLLTASADTREQPLEDLFSNFGSKDPRYLLRRIDPDRYYPVYGDDSTLVEDAPTEGKFYVRLEKGDSHVLWGNFQTQWTGSELTQFNRALYGAELLLKSPAITRFGERQGYLNAFAADPGTLQSRDEFRGTGGSLYYLRHMDITRGSEQVWVEVRDRDSGLVLERKQLVSSQDFDIDYLQGRVMLRSPLSSVTGGASMISTGTLSGNPLFLVTTYEYVPGVTAVDGLALGGNAHQWLGDYVRLGVTGYRQGQNEQQQTLVGGDVILRYAPGTYVKGEVAHSDGPGAGQQNSISGGFDFITTTAGSQAADAKRIDAQIDLADFTPNLKGMGSFYWQDRDQGFSGPGQLTYGEAVRQIGGRMTLPIGPVLETDLKGDDRNSPSQSARNIEGAVRWQVTPAWQLALALRDDNRWTATPGNSVILSENGQRTDMQLRAHYQSLEKQGDKSAVPGNWDGFGFLQGTLAKSGNRRDNNRAGLGGGWQLSDRFRLTGEASYGTDGFGGTLGGDYRINDRSNAYLTFTSETERADLNSRGRYNTAVVGTRYRVSDQMAVFGETKSTHGSDAGSLVHAFGLDYAPTDRWTYGIKAEYGTISDQLSGDLERRAVGVTAAYKWLKINYGTGLEYRNDNGTAGDRDAWLLRNSLSYQADPSWRAFGKFDTSISSNSQGAFYDGDFMELVLGAAYRPILNDRWNLLFKYTYFQDTPSPGQVTADSTIAEYSQRSHVLAMDAIYDLWSWLSLGGKVGFRSSQIRLSRTDGEWFDSNAVLGILRADLHLVRKWDLVVEGRTLAALEAEDQRSGCLLAGYYHVNKYVKTGVGYNFTDFSDDLTDLSYRSHGWFFNVVGGI